MQKTLSSACKYIERKEKIHREESLYIHRKDFLALSVLRRHTFALRLESFGHRSGRGKATLEGNIL